jgi:magnesium-transporting ATPase (P-type)
VYNSLKSITQENKYIHMTSIQPLTSEEVLARQVKESADTSPIRPAPTIVAIEPAHTMDVASSQKTSPADENKFKPEATGFNYRLPLGAYLLAFIYTEIFLAMLLVAGFTISMYWQYNPSVQVMWGVVSKETWITMVVAGTLSLFILSGSNVLRWFTIAAASVLSAISAYQVFNLVFEFTEANNPTFGYTYLLSMMGASVAVLVGGLLLSVTTVAYLLRKKVAAVYE